MTFRFEAVAADDVRPEWDELARSGKNVFGTPEFLTDWWRLVHGGEPQVWAARVDGELRAVASLAPTRRGPLRLLRLAGVGPGDELGPVCAPADRPAALAALGALARELPHDVFLVEQLPGEESPEDVLGARVLAREGSPVLARPEGGWDELLAGRSRNFREQVRRRERKLFREHECRFRPGDPERLDADLDVLFALHGARWRRGSAFAAAERFQRAFAHRAAEQGWLRLWFLEVDGVARAAWHGFRFGGVESYYQAGRDPAWDHASVGFVLLAHTVRASFEDGVDEYRFLRGDEPFKYRFADRDPGLVSVGRTPTPLGRAALAAAVGARAARRRLYSLRR